MADPQRLDAMKDCPVPKCGTRIVRDMVLCRRHWSKVPVELRREVWRTYRRGEGSSTPGYIEARDAAIRAASE